MPLIFDLIFKNSEDSNINEIMNANVSQLNDFIKEHYKEYIKYQNQIFIMAIRYDYYFKRTYRKLNIRQFR